MEDFKDYNDGKIGKDKIIWIKDKEEAYQEQVKYW